MKISVLGAGSFGTALAQLLAQKGNSVWLWDVDREHLASLEKNRENKKYLPGLVLDKKIQIATDSQQAVEQSEVALFAIPAQHFRAGLEEVAPLLPSDIVLVNVAKGIEQGSLKRMSQIAEELVPHLDYVALSGPSHAEEVALKLATTVAVASKKENTARRIQDLFMTDYFRVYTSHDVTGLELGGALKNIIALGAGISDGVGFGDNAKAALMTRGMVEMTRLGIALGAHEKTFAGLAGMGDLIVTCTSMHSRNRRCGILIGQGKKPEEAAKEIGMVVEGMFTAKAAYELAQKVEVEMPITDAIYRVSRGELSPKEAVKQLMGREKKHEQG